MPASWMTGSEGPILAFATMNEIGVVAAGTAVADGPGTGSARPAAGAHPTDRVQLEPGAEFSLEPRFRRRHDAAGKSEQTLVIACGALAREIVDLVNAHGLDRIAVTCLPAIWHNTPQKIPEGVRAKIRAAKGEYGHIVVAYGDCGTGGLLDRVIEEEGVARIDGPHCYQFYMGTADFTALTDAEPGCFFLTDYLARHFDRLIVEGLGLDRHPELRDDYFGNYTRLVYLAQVEDPALDEAAERAAARLGLKYERRQTGYGELGDFIRTAGETTDDNPDKGAA
jgi:hypothetical protein